MRCEIHDQAQIDSEDFLFRLSMLILSEILRNEFKHSTIVFHL